MGLSTGRGLDRDPQSAEQSGFPGIIKISGNIGTGPGLRSPFLHPYLSTVPFGLLFHVHGPQCLLSRPRMQLVSGVLPSCTASWDPLGGCE